MASLQVPAAAEVWELFSAQAMFKVCWPWRLDDLIICIRACAGGCIPLLVGKSIGSLEF